MFAKKRINEIAEYLRIHHAAKVSELSEIFEVSEVTIRKDLSVLEDENLIEKSFGGAIWKEQSISSEIDNDIKMITQRDEKIQLAKEVISEINNGDTIFLDAGSTNNILVDYLNVFTELTIITNDLLIAIKLTENPNFRLIFVGGEISRVSKASVDYMTTKMLLNFNLDISILGCDSFSVKDGASTTSMDKATLKNTAMSIASKSILLTTSDKYYRRGLVKFAQLNEFDKIYTNNTFDDVRKFKDLEDISFIFC